MRKIMRADGINIPENASNTLDTARELSEKEIEIQETASLPSIKAVKPDKQKAVAPEQIAEPMSIEESKSQEILSHLKTVMLVSALCLVIVGSLYFLESKTHWVEQVLLSPLFGGK